jgi:plastocyanin
MPEDVLRLIRSKMVLVSVAAMVGCRGAASTAAQGPCTGTQEAVGPSVVPSSVTVSVGDTVRFSATSHSTCAPWNSPAQWRWRSGNVVRMTVDSLSGLATARDTGMVVIVATSTLDPTVSGAGTAVITP